MRFPYPANQCHLHPAKPRHNGRSPCIYGHARRQPSQQLFRRNKISRACGNLPQQLLPQQYLPGAPQPTTATIVPTLFNGGAPIVDINNCPKNTSPVRDKPPQQILPRQYFTGCAANLLTLKATIAPPVFSRTRHNCSQQLLPQNI